MLVIFALTGLTSSCSTSSAPKADWSTATGADVAAYATFGWIDDFSAAPNTILDQQISNALRNGLRARGYLETSEVPDFRVSYETFELETTERSNPVRIGIGVGSWGGSTGGSVGSSVDVGRGEEVRLQHQLVVRILDSRTDEEVWIGTTTTFEQHAGAGVIDSVVAELLEGIPNKRL
jgi:hypothetical protein